MSINNNNGRRAAWARGAVALCTVLAMWLGALASSAEAKPFAYVANAVSNTVSAILVLRDGKECTVKGSLG
jgi:hypothetical protein